MSHQLDEITEKIGLFHVAHKLSVMHWNVLLASRSAFGLDMIVYSTTAKRKHSIEVKTLSGRNDVPPQSSKRERLWDFLVICDLETERVECSYVLKKDDYDAGLHRYGNGTIAVQRKYFTQFKDRWDKI